MPRAFRVLFPLLATLAAISLIGPSFDAFAKDKKDDKKEAAKDAKKDDKDKKDAKKDDKDKKEEKKEPFKPDPAQIELKPDEKDKTYWVYSLAFSADGKTLAAAYRSSKSVLLWDIITKKAGKTLKTPEIKGLGDFKSLLFVNDLIYVGTGKLNKVADKAKEKEKTKEDKKEKDKAKEKEKVKEAPLRHGEIKVWNAKSGMPEKSLLGHDDNVEALALSTDGKFLASASKDGAVKIWDLANGMNTQTIKAHADDVNSVAFSPDGKQIVTTSADKTVRIWTIADAKEIANFKVEREIETKDPKGKVTKSKEVGRMFTRAVFTNDGKKVIAGNLDGLVKIYDVEGKKEVQEWKAHDGIWALAMNADGTKFATGGFDGTIKLWNPDGKLLKTIKAYAKGTEPGTVIALAFSPDGQWLASGSTDDTVKIWSVK